MENNPTNRPTNQKPVSIFHFFKNIFWIIIFLQFAPILLNGIRGFTDDIFVPKTKVGVLNISGALTSAAFFENNIEKFEKAKDIKGLILKINSPGGMPGTAQSIFNEIKKFRTQKPVVVVIENICTSAAYYIATAGDKIIANPSSMVGGIGVLLELPNVKELLNSWKVKFDYIKSGTYKTAGSPLTEITQKELDYLQALSDDTYKQFISDVSTERKISDKEFETWADGKVFTGNQALKLNLIDSIGSLKDGVNYMKLKLNLTEKDEIKLVKSQQKSGIMKYFGSSQDLSEKIASFANEIYSKFMFLQKTKQINLS